MFVRLEVQLDPETGPRKYYPDNIMVGVLHYNFVGIMRSRYSSNILFVLLVCLLMIPSVSADSVMYYSVSEGTRVFYHWTGNRTVSSSTVILDYIVYIEFSEGVPDSVPFPEFLRDYSLFLDNGSSLAHYDPGWPYCSARPGVELAMPPYPLALLPIGNWTYTSLIFNEGPTTDVTENTFSFTIRTKTNTEYDERTFTKSDGIVSHLIYQVNHTEYYSFYYELTRITDWTPLLVISIIGISGVICVVIILRRRRIKTSIDSNKEL